MKALKFAEIWSLVWSVIFVVGGGLMVHDGNQDLGNWLMLAAMFLVLLASYLNGYQKGGRR